VGGWALFHDVLPQVQGELSADSVREAAFRVDIPAGETINGGGIKFAPAAQPDAGQNRRAPAVVGQWQADGHMKVVFPPAYVTS
jgi:branched-chain amino acid transport system substrate-binding protein